MQNKDDILVKPQSDPKRTFMDHVGRHGGDLRTAEGRRDHLVGIARRRIRTLFHPSPCCVFAKNTSFTARRRKITDIFPSPC